MRLLAKEVLPVLKGWGTGAKGGVSASVVHA